MMENKNLSRLIKKISFITTVSLSAIVLTSNAVNFATTQYAIYDIKHSGNDDEACEKAKEDIKTYENGSNLLNKMTKYGSKLASQRYLKDNCENR